MNEVMILC